MKRILSGPQPSGNIHLGNYLGAMKRWAELEAQGKDEYFFFVPNLHALTSRTQPTELAENTMAAVAWLLALGMDWKRTYIYVQSLIPQHSELCWILSNFITFGELSRMTQFKDKSKRFGSEGQLVGLFLYPVLMAADILLYDADEVPVGEDQIQHVEIARDIAERFNKLHGPTFKVPKATIQKVGARIMDLQDPTKKMSKSDGTNNPGCIFMTDSPEVIASKIRRAVTDSSGEIRSHQDKPAVSNLLTIFSLLSGRSIEELERVYADKGYKEFKDDLANEAVEVIAPVRNRFEEIMGDRDRLYAIIQEGSERASRIADLKLQQVKSVLGLL